MTLSFILVNVDFDDKGTVWPMEMKKKDDGCGKKRSGCGNMVLSSQFSVLACWQAGFSVVGSLCQILIFIRSTCRVTVS
jgi:hypothetical protein